ncbi:MucR family transcriptional regulator [Mesorhizobium sp. LHD-90]|uniref:MucR family transcriptional regulator n=1 Tax=Mesorhizobium sp. LHD-90 TaxID=3071414 RepID=UPI0027E1FD95|nr:MucR family transcriptional regulator [Mesorhizobium sp. LHD-90]MDQ6435615.1 MucR family transcriptional regulator [Mesorhizobium sp. LHD-90]
MTNAMDRDSIVALTAELVSAYVSNNAVPQASLPDLIASVHRSLIDVGGEPSKPEPEPAKPAVPIKKSIFPDYLICLEDGKKFKSLKRHLGAHYGLSPDQYRQKWGLPPDYPMVAPNYAARRSELAKGIGLGRKPEPEPVAPAKRGRKPAAK